MEQSPRFNCDTIEKVAAELAKKLPKRAARTTPVSKETYQEQYLRLRKQIIEYIQQNPTNKEFAEVALAQAAKLVKSDNVVSEPPTLETAEKGVVEQPKRLDEFQKMLKNIDELMNEGRASLADAYQLTSKINDVLKNEKP